MYVFFAKKFRLSFLPEKADVMLVRHYVEEDSSELSSEMRTFLQLGIRIPFDPVRHTRVWTSIVVPLRPKGAYEIWTLKRFQPFEAQAVTKFDILLKPIDLDQVPSHAVEKLLGDGEGEVLLQPVDTESSLKLDALLRPIAWKEIPYLAAQMLRTAEGGEGLRAMWQIAILTPEKLLGRRKGRSAYRTLRQIVEYLEKHHLRLEMRFDQQIIAYLQWRTSKST